MIKYHLSAYKVVPSYTELADDVTLVLSVESLELPILQTLYDCLAQNKQYRIYLEEITEVRTSKKLARQRASSDRPDHLIGW